MIFKFSLGAYLEDQNGYCSYNSVRIFLEKSLKTFLRIESESDHPQEILRSYLIPAFVEIRIFIEYSNYQRLKNFTIQTEVDFQIRKTIQSI